MDSSNLQNRQVDLQESQKQTPIQKYEQRISSKIQEFQTAGETLATSGQENKYPFQGAALSLGYLSLKGTRAFTSIYIHPVQAITGIFKPSTYVGIYEGFKEEPIATAIELFAGKKAFDAFASKPFLR